MDGESSDFNAVLAGDVLHRWRLSNDLDKFLACVSVLVELTDVARLHGLRERDVDGVLHEESVHHVKQRNSEQKITVANLRSMSLNFRQSLKLNCQKFIDINPKSIDCCQIAGFVDPKSKE